MIWQMRHFSLAKDSNQTKLQSTINNHQSTINSQQDKVWFWLQLKPCKSWALGFTVKKDSSLAAGIRITGRICSFCLSISGGSSLTLEHRNLWCRSLVCWDSLLCHCIFIVLFSSYFGVVVLLWSCL